MTKMQPTPDDALLVAIDVAKARNEILIEVPGGRRRRLTVLNNRAEHDQLVAMLKAYERAVLFILWRA